MPKRGGYRAQGGRPKGIVETKPRATSRAKAESDAVKFPPSPLKVIVAVGPSFEPPPPDTPLGYLLALMNDPTVDEVRRDRAAMVAVAYMHPRISDNRFSKRDAAKAAAEQAGKTGKFAQAVMPPKLVVNNGED